MAATELGGKGPWQAAGRAQGLSGHVHEGEAEARHQDNGRLCGTGSILRHGNELPQRAPGWGGCLEASRRLHGGV